MHIKITMRDFPGGPGVKNLPSNAGNVGSVLGRGTKIPPATEQLTHVLQLLSPHSRTQALHLDKGEEPAHCSEGPAQPKNKTMIIIIITIMRYHYTSVRMTKIKNTYDKK